MTLKEQIMKLQTYKMYEGEESVYVERDDVIKALEQEPCEDCISRQAVIDIIDFEDKWLHDASGHNANTKIAFSGLKSKVKALTSVTPEKSEDCISRKAVFKVPQENTMLTLCDECRAELHGSDEFFNFDSPMVKGDDLDDKDNQKHNV